MQPQQNNNKQSRSRSNASSSTRGFSTSRSRSNASSTTRVFSNPPPVVFQQQGVSSSNTSSSTTRGFSTSTPVVSQQQTFHPVSIDLRTTSITQLPKHLTKMLSKKPSKTKLSPVMERNSNPDSLKRNSNSGGVSDVSEVDFASIMSAPEDLLIPDFLRTPPRQISPEVAQLDMVQISTDLEEHTGFGEEHLETYLPNYFHDMPTTWDQPEEIPEPDMTHLVTTNIQPDILVPVTPPLPLAQERNSNPSDLKRNSNSGGKRKIHSITTERTMVKPLNKLTTTNILDCLKSIHDAYLYSSKGIPVTIEEEHIASILGPGTLDEHRRKIRDVVRECSDTKYKQLEKTFKKNYHMDLVEYGDKIKELVKQSRQQIVPARQGTPPPAPRLSPVEAVDLSSQEEIVEATPPPKPKPITLSVAAQAKILINRCRQAARLTPLDVPEECTIEELTEAVRDEVQALDEKVALLEDELLEQQEVPEEKEEMLDFHMVQVYKEYETLCQFKKIQPMGISMFPSEQDILQAIQSIQGPPPPPPPPPINFLPRSAAEVESIEVPEEPLEPLEDFDPFAPEVIPQEPEVEDFTVAYSEYAGICEEMGLVPKEMAEFSDFKEIDAEIERLETPKAPLQMKAAAEPKPEPKDPTPEPDADAVKLPESEEDEPDDEDPISPDRKTQLVQVFARYSKMPTDVFLLVIDYLLQIEFYAEAAAVVKAHHRLLETEIPYCLKHMSRVFLNYFDHFYKVKEIPAHQSYKTDEYGLMVMMRDNIYRMQERRYRYANSHRPMIEYLLADSKRVKELKGIIDSEHSQLNLANQMAIENMPEEYDDVDAAVWQHKSQNVTALHELGSPEYVPQNEREQKFQEQLQNSKAVQRRNKKKQKRNQKLADLHAAAEPKDPKRDPDTDAPAVPVATSLKFVGGASRSRKPYKLGDIPIGNQRADFSFRPEVGSYSAAELVEYRNRGPVNTRAVRYPDDQGVQIVEPYQQPPISKSRKSKKKRVDPFEARELALRTQSTAPIPRQRIIEPEFVPEPSFNQFNKRTQRTQDKSERFAQFDEDGQVIYEEEKKRGRPSKPKSQHKYQKKYQRKGRPTKAQQAAMKAQESPPWTPAVLPVNLWYSPSGFLQGVPEAQPLPTAVRDAYAAHQDQKQNTFNDEIEEVFIEAPNRPPKYSWEDRKHWERKKVIQDLEQDFKKRFVSTGLMPISGRALQPPPAPRLRPVEEVADVLLAPVEQELRDFAEAAAADMAAPAAPRRRRGRPPLPPKPVGIGKRAFAKTSRKLEALIQERMEKERNELESTLLFNRARQLNIPHLSANLRRVYKRSLALAPGVVFRDTSFVFNYDQGSLEDYTLYGYRYILWRQTSQMPMFLLNVLGAAISKYRYLIHYEGPNGHRSVSTSWYSDYQRAFDHIELQLGALMAQYGEEEITIEQLEIKVQMDNQSLVGGMTSKEFEAQIGDMKSRWLIVNPCSKTNCLWTSIAIADGFEDNPDLLDNHKIQNITGSKLKQKVGTRNEKGGNEEDLNLCATYKGRTIIVHDGFEAIMGTFVPDQFRTPVPEPIHLLLLNAHYHAMIPIDHPAATHCKNSLQVNVSEGRDCKPIPKCNKEFEARRIVAYDLESYKEPRHINKGGGIQEEEIHQIAYACAWAFQVENKEEETYCRDNGYQLLNYTFNHMDITVAYQRILGEDCLDESLQLWTTQPIFDHAVFYAHNGGKFDMRLILGQSDLMYKESYCIKPEKTIELNGRIINMDIENITQTYEEEKTNAKGKTYKIRYNHTISIRDSIPLFGPESSLASLCKELKVPHQKLEELINVHDLQYEDTWLLNWYGYDMDTYLMNDVLGLLEVLIQFNENVEQATTIPITCVNTGASLAKKYFLMHYYKEENASNQTIFTLDAPMDQFIRQGYGGGRCEAFISKEWQERCYYYDFTSLYPDVGRNLMPTGKPKWISDPETPNANRVQFMWEERIVHRRTMQEQMFWKVRVRSPLAASGQRMDPLHRKPLFGMKEEDMYVFRWYSEWTEMVIYEPELLFAIDQGLDYEFEPVNGILFEEACVLKDCMEELFKKKAEATANNEDALAKTWKVILNSLYGVWGLKILDREGIEISRPHQSNWAIDLVTDKLMDIDKIGRYIVTRRLKDLEVSDCNVAIAAAVTAYARMKLYEVMVDIQDAGGMVLYCDTDSIITNYCIETDARLKEKWIGPSEGKDLGSLKNEIHKCYDKLLAAHPEYTRTNYFDKAVIVAPKLYVVSAADGHIIKKAHKGYKENKSAGDIVTYERMLKLVDEREPEEDRQMVQTTAQWLGGNRDLLKNNIGVRIVQRKKHLKQTVNKGHLQQGVIVPYVAKPNKKR